ncbi:MAG: [NiFe]-hydrogenase assembly chaperone HybE [Mariprofundus sp.]|nr:[NiFe]-hydrogenase assembly chaperone HybE [Mariprofundus sp.]
MPQLLKELSPMGAAYHLEQLYDVIRTDRMLGIPILNDQIKVQAVGFRVWDGHVLGVLITPWFMNLMLLPGEDDDWSTFQIGSKHLFSFAAGSFEFIVGEEPELGHYMSCSMFSPMFEFESHEAAVITAEAIVPGLFNEQNKEVLEARNFDGSPASEHSNKTDLSSKSLPATILEGVQVVSEATKQSLDQPLSRRDLLRGSFLRRQSSPSGE